MAEKEMPEIGEFAMTSGGALADWRRDLRVYEVTNNDDTLSYMVVDKYGRSPNFYPRLIPFVDEADWQKRRDRAAAKKRHEVKGSVVRLNTGRVRKIRHNNA